MKSATILFLAVGLAGCAIAALNDAEVERDRAYVDYRTCLKKNPPTACESQRLIYEAALVRYESIRRRVQNAPPPPPGVILVR